MVLGIMWLVAVLVGIVVDAKSFDVEDCFHVSCTRTVHVGRKVVRKDVWNDGILA